MLNESCETTAIQEPKEVPDYIALEKAINVLEDTIEQIAFFMSELGYDDQRLHPMPEQANANANAPSNFRQVLTNAPTKIRILTGELQDLMMNLKNNLL